MPVAACANIINFNLYLSTSTLQLLISNLSASYFYIVVNKHDIAYLTKSTNYKGGYSTSSYRLLISLESCPRQVDYNYNNITIPSYSKLWILLVKRYLYP